MIAHDRLAPGYLGAMGQRGIQIISEKGMPALTENGILGDPRKASAERGEIYLEKIADLWVREIG